MNLNEINVLKHQEPIDTDKECPVIPVHDYDLFIKNAYERIKHIGITRNKSEAIITNTGGYIELKRAEK